MRLLRLFWIVDEFKATVSFVGVPVDFLTVPRAVKDLLTFTALDTRSFTADLTQICLVDAIRLHYFVVRPSTADRH